ncbi:MAG: hypothetical protein HW400_296 [Candidatus Levybacteria bacterium]|nr:hypothetical protein [Candidatus Levybacteria bacterium]
MVIFDPSSFGHSKESEPIARHKSTERSPITIATQTCTLLEILQKNVIRKPDLAKDYLHNFTFSYLNQAETGADILYDNKGNIYKDLEPEIRETAQHAFVVFAHMPDNVKSGFLPMGFSRRGMLRAPQTKDEFVNKLKELKVGVWQVLERKTESGITLEANPRLLRTFGFFKTGSELPLKMSETEKQREKLAKEKFDHLLKDINVSL